MKNTLMLVRIDSKYCDYLRKFDNKVPFNYKDKELRPFVGVLFEVNKCMYFAPLSSPKPKHLKLKAKLDFLKLDGGKLGAINFNNMLPVTKNNIIKIDLNKKCKDKEELKYMNLLKEQIYWLNRNEDKLYGRAEKLYNKYINNKLDITIRNRCCNFKLLEDKCKEYNNLIKNREEHLIYG